MYSTVDKMSINFNDLPCDIKRLIFNCNRDEAIKQKEIEDNEITVKKIYVWKSFKK